MKLLGLHNLKRSNVIKSLKLKTMMINILKREFTRYLNEIFFLTPYFRHFPIHEEETRPVERQIEARSVDNEMASVVRCLQLCSCHILNSMDSSLHFNIESNYNSFLRVKKIDMFALSRCGTITDVLDRYK